MRDGRFAHVFIGLFHLDEQRHIDRGVFSLRVQRAFVALGQGGFGQAVALPPGHQAGELRPAVAAGVQQVPPLQPTFAFFATGVVKALGLNIRPISA